MGDWQTELTGRVLVLVAHADDECVGYGALLQKMRQPVLAIATNAAARFGRQHECTGLPGRRSKAPTTSCRLPARPQLGGRGQRCAARA